MRVANSGRAVEPVDPLSIELRELLDQPCDFVTLGEMVDSLKSRGQALVMLVVTFPFCSPITIPGLSVAFGLFLAINGFFIAMERPPWTPRFLHDRPIPKATLRKIVDKLIWVLQKLEKIAHPRLSSLTTQYHICRLHGAYIVLFALILCLPLPIPFTNASAAIPIFLLAMGMLQADGYFVIASYIMGVVCIAYFSALALAGDAGFEKLLSIF